MSEKVTELLHQISRLENELRVALTVKEVKVVASSFEPKGDERLHHSAMSARTRSKRSLLKWTQFRNIISLPVIYGLIVPMVFLDICVSFYHFTCFPLFNIQKSRRRDFISIGRHKLTHLNFIEKFHCLYCEYINGLLSYVTDIASKTEQYFCPIKYANKTINVHSRYRSFQDFEDPRNFHENLEAFRQSLKKGNPSANKNSTNGSPHEPV